MSRGGPEVAPRAGDQHAEEQLLLALAAGSYLLSTPDGVVAECGQGALALLGAAPEDAAGADAAGLLAGATGDERDHLAGMLRTGGGIVMGREPTERRPGLELTVVPVPLALGWEFTSLLGELGTRDPGTWTATGLRRRHEHALDVIAAVGSGAEREAEARLAGVLVVLREAQAPALTREAVHDVVVARRAAAQDAAVADADGSAAGPGGAESWDLRDVVEQARTLRGRLEEAERWRDAEAERRVAAEAEAQAAREDAERARHELETSAAAAPREEEARREAEQARSEAEAARAGLEAVQTEATNARAQLEAAQAVAAEARAELGVTRASLQQAQISAATAGHQTETLQAELAAVQAELAGARDELEQARAEREALRGQLADAQARASREAESARAAADAIRAEFALETPAAASAANGQAPALPEPSAPGQASALIGPNGAFVALDAAFCAMLGYRAEQLRAARWPSVIDRENAEAHREIARALRAGEIDDAQVETCYMHAQGLLVPVAGTISAVRDEDRPPGHLLFRVATGRGGGR